MYSWFNIKTIILKNIKNGVKDNLMIEETIIITESVKNTVFSAVISKLISDGIDIGREKIREIIKNKSNKNGGFCKEIYTILVNVVNKVTYNKMGEKIYDIAENILLNLLENKYDYKEVIRMEVEKNGVYSLNVEKFVDIFIREICSDKNENVYREIEIHMLLSNINNNRLVMQELQEIKKLLKKKVEENDYRYKKRKNKTEIYAGKWNDNMFLNDYDARDEKAGVNIKLKDIYTKGQLPHYIWRENVKENGDIDELLKEYIYEFNKNKMLLILGQPGIGKSTLITWLINNYIEIEKDILVYRVASDLKNIDWRDKEHLVSSVLRELALSYDQLDEKIIILDGFDEIDIKKDRIEILNHIYEKIVNENSISKFSLIITCRENYIENRFNLNCDYIVLQPFDEIQIKSFCKLYQSQSCKGISKDIIKNLIDKKEIFGIPLILYMILALNISVDKENSIVDVYDKIFSLKNGIYNRCIDGRYFDNAHRINKMKTQIHQISRDIAIWIFENEPSKAIIPIKDYEKIYQNNMAENEFNSSDGLIGNYFKMTNYVQGLQTEEIYFAHRSIYEYFVIETIYSSIEDIMQNINEKKQEELAGCIAIYLKNGQLTPTMCEYMQYKMHTFVHKYYNNKTLDFLEWWEEIFQKMLSKGMFYYTKKTVGYYNNIINQEIICFLNMLKIVRLIFEISNTQYMLDNVDKNLISKYIKYYGIEVESFMCLPEQLDLSRCNLYGIDLTKVNAVNWKFNDSKLSMAKLQDMDLTGSNFENTILESASMILSNISNINLIGADIKGIFFDSNQVVELEKNYDLKGSKIYIIDKKKIVMYEEYN